MTSIADKENVRPSIENRGHLLDVIDAFKGALDKKVKTFNIEMNEQKYDFDAQMYKFVKDRVIASLKSKNMDVRPLNSSASSFNEPDLGYTAFKQKKLKKVASKDSLDDLPSKTKKTSSKMFKSPYLLPEPSQKIDKYLKKEPDTKAGSNIVSPPFTSMSHRQDKETQMTAAKIH